MATMITSECINCGACEPECPNTAIYQGGVEWQAPDGTLHPPLSNDIFYIVPEKCTECVGFHDHEACAAVCPVDCCVPDPRRPETHEVLLARARALHPGEVIPDDAPSRFKREGAAAPAPAPAATAPPTAPAAPAAASAPAVPPQAATAAAKPAPRSAAGAAVEKPVAAPKAPARQVRTFAGELPTDFETLLAELGPPRRRGGRTLPLVLLGALQGVLGALPAAQKERLEAAVADRRFFDAQLATAANVFLNLVLYPIGGLAVGLAADRVGLFTLAVRPWVFWGFVLGVAEACWRLRENIFRGVPLAATRLRGAFYGLALAPIGRLVLTLVGPRGVESGVSFDGFYAGREPFDEKLERARRYGEVYRVVDRDDAYLVHVEFPRTLPPSSLAEQLDLPAEMPDYEYELELKDGTFLVHGRVVDPRVRKLTGAAPAFPSAFTTRVALRDPVVGFRHRYRDKTLEVILPKAQSRT
jgi:ferredoxin